MTTKRTPLLAAAFATALIAPGVGLAAAAPPAVGATLPDLTLPTLDDSRRTLSERDGPTVLVFFRGVW
jgi:hypothetical protein